MFKWLWLTQFIKSGRGKLPIPLDFWHSCNKNWWYSNTFRIFITLKWSTDINLDCYMNLKADCKAKRVTIYIWISISNALFIYSKYQTLAKMTMYYVYVITFWWDSFNCINWKCLVFYLYFWLCLIFLNEYKASSLSRFLLFLQKNWLLFLKHTFSSSIFQFFYHLF